MGADNQAEKVIERLDARDEVARIAEVMKTLRCLFGCHTPVVGVYSIPMGCVCRNDPVQALCAQHAISAEPLGSMVLICGPGPAKREEAK